jgi:signal transduction histidine kinase
MSFTFEPTPFTGQDWKRRFELYDSISLWGLVFSCVVLAFYVLVTVFQFSFQYLVLCINTALMVVVCVLGRMLARRGHLDLAIYMLLGMVLVVMSISSLALEGIVLMAATFYVAVIVMSGVMLGSRASFLVAAVACVLYVAVSLISRQPFITPLALGDGWMLALASFISILVFLFVAQLVRLTTQDLRRALQDATYDLVKANEELQEANRLKNRFLARVSHELRTPLNAIIGYTDMNVAGYYGELNVDQLDALERVRRNGRQLLHLINDVLDLSRIDAQGVELRERSFSPNELVCQVINTVEPQVQKKGLQLTHEIDPALPERLVGDEVRLNQVLVNLVDNAIKFTEHGGVHIAARNGETDTWMLQVRDTGRGISERELPYIFEEFRQGAVVYGKQADGVGLGLAIAHRLVTAMKGTIRVQSRLGAGSTFTVVLPVVVTARREEKR